MTLPLRQVPLFSSLATYLCPNLSHQFHIITMASSSSPSSSSLAFPHTLLPSLSSSNSINLTFIINYIPTNKSHLLLSKHKLSSSFSPIKCSSSSISSLIPKLDQDNNKHEHHDHDHDEGVPSLHEIWREIQGCNNWEGLLDPMNPHLRREIIRYGEIAQSCYDSFDFDPHSKYCGTCKYHPSEFFQKLDFTTNCASYDITRYLYATSNINLPNFFQKSSSLRSIWSPHANWMGYVGIVNAADDINRLGRRDIVIAWRGTVTYLEWIYDLKDILRPANFRGEGDNSVKIESGFYDLYTKKEDSCNYCSFSAREQVLAEVKRLIEYYGDDEEISITITGHSLGAALAILSAYDIAEMNVNVVNDGGGGGGRKIPITVYSFAGPRVGNLRFKERCEELGVKVLRVINVHDKVPTVPGIITNEKFQFQKYLEETLSFPWSYAHVGVELALDHKHSPFLKPTNDLLCAHNLEAHLHLVDGYHGQGRHFHLANERDIALVNKSCDFLLSEYEVPPFWRQDENKGMVRTSDGRWVVPERPRLEAHPPDTAHHLQQVLKRNGIFQLRDT